MATPYISIIVPIYNAEPWIKQCVTSVLSQQFHNFELLLIDDGSTDNSGHLCDEFSNLDSRIRVFHQKNAGVSAARNHGIIKSTGQWITFIDADDWVKSSYLSDFPLESLDQSCFYTQEFDDEQLKNPKTLQYSSSCLKLFSAEIIKKRQILFNTNLSMGEDTVFNILYSQYVQKKVNISAKNYYTRFVPDSACFKVDNYKCLYTCIDALKTLNKTVCPTPVYSVDFLNDIIRVNCFHFIRRMYDSGCETKQRIHYLKHLYNSSEDVTSYYVSIFKTDLLVRLLLRLRCYCGADSIILIRRKLQLIKNK